MSNVPPPNPFAVNQASPPALNPYEVTSANLAPTLGTDAESIRKQYIAHEASVKSIGTLYFLGALMLGFFTLIYAGMFIVALTSTDPEAQMLLIPAIIGAIFAAVIGTLQGFTAVGLWKLKPWARIVATVLSCIGLIGIPIGTIISAYFLYLLQSQKGNVVFSDSYKTVIQQTPHVKYRTSILAWIALALIVLLVVGVVVMAAFGGRR